MPAYKVYCLDGQGRLVSAAEIIEAQSDAEVVALMRSQKRAVRCDIWEGERFIATVRAHSASL